MNALSLQALGVATRPSSHEGERFHLLPPSVQRRVLARAIEWGVMNGIAEIRRCRPGANIRGMGDLSQADQQTVADSVGSALAPILGSTLSSTTATLSTQAATVIGPVLEQKLAAYGPTFAIIMGLVAATFSVLGMALMGGWLMKKLR